MNFPSTHEREFGQQPNDKHQNRLSKKQIYVVYERKVKKKGEKINRSRFMRKKVLYTPTQLVAQLYTLNLRDSLI